MATASSTEASSPGPAVASSADLQELISKFVADGEARTLELPAGLSPEKRKEAKRLAEQQFELKCESYGLGEERRLHLFKKQEGQVSVKNTFIDDWVGGTQGGGREEPAFRSMPPGSSLPVDLLERTLQRCGLDINKEGKAGTIREGSSGAGSPRSSTTGGGTDVRLETSPTASSALPTMPEGVKVDVRNTFIHIEQIPVVERVVQSMPHGMFRQCLEAELQAQQGELQAAAAAAGAAPEGDPTSLVPAPPSIPPPPVAAPMSIAPPPTSALLGTSPMLGTSPPAAGSTNCSRAGPSRAAPATAPAGDRTPMQNGAEAGERTLEPGTEVIIQGLLRMPDFNGLTGEVKSVDADSGRYNVLLDGPVGQCGWQWVKVKAENCRLKVPPPPRNAPTLAMDCLPDAQGGAEEASAGGPLGSSVPATPKWEEDFGMQARPPHQSSGR